MIEHLGTFDDRLRAVQEIRRVGKRYFIQTSNYYFPIEPHFLFPFFQFLPIKVRIFLLTLFNLGWCKKELHVKDAERVVTSVHLLRKSELVKMFPSAVIYEEKIMGCTKSFIIYKW